jgi:actin-related protein
VGTGQSGVAQDIHWHIAAQVWYLPLDKERQDISWVGVVDDDGKLTEYYDMSKVSQSTPDRIEKEARLMDCIDCHNRATHQFQSPETLIDKAILQGQISPALPYIKKQAMDALGTPRSSLDEAYKKVDAIRDFYAINYPSVITQHKGDLDTAIAALREIATLTTFPYMKLTWNTYLNNLGHIESPGCYRCHGKLVGTTPGPQLGKTIDSECASCHYFQAGGIQK